MKKMTLSLLALCLSMTMLHAQWEKSSGLTADKIHILTTDPASPKTVYAGTDRGVFVSKDNGECWAMMNNGLTYKDVWSICARGGQVLAGSFDVWHNGPKGDVSLSRDAGKNWISTSSGLPSKGAHALAFCSSGIIAATSEGMFRTSDNGASWQLAFTTPKHEFQNIAATPRGLIAGSRFEGPYRSQDDGLTWERMNLGKECSSISGIACTGNTIYVAAETIVEFHETNSWGNKSLSILFRSTDAGMHWQDLSIPEEPIIEGVYSSGDTVITVFNSLDPSQGGITVHSMNFASSKTTANDGNPSSIPAKSEPQSESVEGPAGIHISIDGGRTWTVANEGLPVTSIKTLTVRDGYVFAGTYTGGLFRRPLSQLIAAAKAGRK